MHSERRQSDADAAAAVYEQRTREMCVRARYRTIYGRHDIVRWMNLRSISRYRVIDMITRKMLYHMEKATITKTSTSMAIYQGRTSQEMLFSTPSSSTTLCLKKFPPLNCL